MRRMQLLRLCRETLADLRRDTSGQDMIEYALVAAALVVIVAGVLPPQILPAVSAVFSRITSTMAGS